MNAKSVIGIRVNKDVDGNLRWQMTCKGQIVAEGGRGYTKKPALMRAVHKLIEALEQGDYRWDEELRVREAKALNG